MSAFEAIDIITKKVTRENLNTEKSQLRFLTYWWSNKYNRPLKDPLIQDYTIEELYYEYRLHTEFTLAAEEKSTQESDKIEEQKQDATLAWADAEEAKELEELKEKMKQNSQNKDVTITKDDTEWMSKQIESAKETYGDSFGEDITEDFSDE
jgi:hypothetical protein